MSDFPRPIRMHQVLPVAFATRLRAMHAVRPVSPQLCATIAAAKQVGWGYKAVADALGVTREYIRQLAGKAPEGLASHLVIPDPPMQPVPWKRVIPTLTAEQAEQLRDLNLRGRPTGKMAADHPAVVAAREFAVALAAYLAAGYRLVDIARVLGISEAAIRFRLGRHGYRGLPPSQQHRPGPVSREPVGAR